MTGRLKDISLNLDGSQDLRITFNTNVGELFDELQGKDVSVEIKKLSKRRSLDANALCWYIIDKIAEKTNLKKTEVYKNAIRDIGGVSDVVCVRDYAVEKLTNGWTEHGQGWQVELSPSRLRGCTNVTLYYGSSVYDSKQMSALIDSLIQDATALGIPTPTQQEIEKSLEIWGRKKKEVDTNENESPREEASPQEDDEESLY